MPTMNELAAYVERGLVSRRTRGDLIIYNYTPQCTYEKAWDDVTMAARGLVFTCEGVQITTPFRKFFNHFNTERCVIPDGPPDSATVKMDGSLGIGFMRHGAMVWTTRGAFDSPQAAAAQAMWNERYDDVPVPPGWTILAEIIHPAAKIVIRYDWSDLVVLGIYDEFGHDLEQGTVENCCADLGLRCVQRVPGTYDELLALSKTLDDQHEGFVLRWGDHRIKVKGAAYFEVARLLQGLNERTVADYWYHEIDLPEALPRETRVWASKIRDSLEADRNRAIGWTAALFGRCGGRSADRKSFALAAKGDPLFSLAMRMYARQYADYTMFVYRQRFNGKPRPACLGEHK